MSPSCFASLARWSLTVLLLCAAGEVRAQQEEPQALATDAHRLLSGAYALRMAAPFAVATNATNALTDQLHDRVRAREIDATVRAEQRRMASTGIRMALTGISSASFLIPGMEVSEGEQGLALCRDAPKLLPIHVQTLQMEGVDGPAREVSVECDADLVIVGLKASPAPVQVATRPMLGRGSSTDWVALMGGRMLQVRSGGHTTEGVWVAERQASAQPLEQQRVGPPGPDEVRVDVPGLKSNGLVLQLVFAGDLNGDGHLDAILRFAATLESDDSVDRNEPEGFVWRLLLSNGADAAPQVAAWTIESSW